jgi:hypothetical protein
MRLLALEGAHIQLGKIINTVCIVATYGKGGIIAGSGGKAQLARKFWI